MMVRCPNCRGMKTVPKLGGMMGDCNMCNGVGSIPVSDKAIKKIVIPEPSIEDIKLAVETVVPVLEKTEIKKTVFKKKRA